MTSQEFIEVMSGKYLWDVERVNESTEIGELMEWDSMAILGFLAMADKNLGVSPPPEKVVGAKSIGDLLALVSAGLADG